MSLCPCSHTACLNHRGERSNGRVGPANNRALSVTGYALALRLLTSLTLARLIVKRYQGITCSSLRCRHHPVCKLHHYKKGNKVIANIPRRPELTTTLLPLAKVDRSSSQVWRGALNYLAGRISPPLKAATIRPPPHSLHLRRIPINTNPPSTSLHQPLQLRHLS